MKWSDRKILLVSGAIMLVLATGMVILAPPEQVARGGIPSIYGTAPDGARAAYLLLLHLKYPVRIWTQPPDELPQESNNAILILADPMRDPSPQDRESLRNFVIHGGRILFTGRLIGQFFSGTNVTPHFSTFDSHTYDRNQPSNFTYDAPRISIGSEALWTALNNRQFALYGKTPDVAVVRWHLGDGEILWWAGPEPLTNGGITRESNLNLLLNAVGGSKAGGGPIYWDEYFHGEGDSLWVYFEKTPLPWGLWQLSFIAIAVLIGFSRRSGPIVPQVTVSRRSPLEYVDTLGGLYERAHAEPAIVQIVYDRFRLTLKRTLRLPSVTSDTELEQIASKRLGAKEHDLGNLLKRASAAAHSAKVSPAQALAIVRDLENYEQEIGVKKTQPS